MLVAIGSLRLRGVSAIGVGLLVSDWLLVSNWLLVAAIGDWLRVAAISDRLGVNDGLRSVCHGPRLVWCGLDGPRLGAGVQSLGFYAVGATRVSASSEAAKSSDTANSTRFEQTGETKARSELTSEATCFELILKRITAKRRSFEAILRSSLLSFCCIFIRFFCFIIEFISGFTINLDSTLSFDLRAFGLDFAFNFSFGTNFNFTNCLKIGVNLLLAANLRLRSSLEVDYNLSLLWDLNLLRTNFKFTLYLEFILVKAGRERSKVIAGSAFIAFRGTIAISGEFKDISRVVDEVKLVEGVILVECVVLVDISCFDLVSGHIRVIFSVFVDVISGVTVIALFVRFV